MVTLNRYVFVCFQMTAMKFEEPIKILIKEEMIENPSILEEDALFETNSSVKIKEETLESDSMIVKKENSDQKHFEDEESNFESDPLLSDENSFIDTDSITIKEEPLEANLIEDNFVAIKQEDREKSYHEKQELSLEDRVINVSWVGKYECKYHEKSFKCEAQFSTQKELKVHVITNHINPELKKSTPLVVPTETKPCFKCPFINVCDYKTTEKEEFSKHIQIHIQKTQRDVPRFDSVMTVTCKSIPAKMYKDKFESGGKGKCILYQKQWLTPNHFEELAGSKSKKYKSSIKCLGRPLSEFLESGKLIPTILHCENRKSNDVK